MKKLLLKRYITNKKILSYNLFFIIFSSLNCANHKRLLPEKAPSQRKKKKQATNQEQSLKPFPIDNVTTFKARFDLLRQERKEAKKVSSPIPKPKIESKLPFATEAQKKCCFCTASFMRKDGPCINHKNPSQNKKKLKLEPPDEFIFS